MLIMLKRFSYILILALLFSGCSNRKGGDSGVAPYTIATLKGPSSMGMIRLIDSLNNGSSHSVEVKILNEPLQVRKMMLDGSADFAILPTTMAAIMYNKGLDYRLIAVPVWGTLYLVGSDTTVSSWEDLRGKRVYVMARGMTPDVLFRYLLINNGIDPEKDITPDYSFPTHIDLANAVAAGKAPLAVLSEPLASLVAERNTGIRHIFDLGTEWDRFVDTPMAETAFLGSAEIIRDNPGLVESVVSAYSLSTEWVNRHPDSAALLIVKYDILPDPVVAVTAIHGSNLRFESAAAVEKDVMDYLNVFYKLNPDIVGGKLPDEDFIAR
jgi:NitT/TauT family transport system substrate-binding protein